MTALGFIGAGRMGGAVARRLATGGHDVAVYDPSPDAVAACVEVGARAAESAVAAVRGAEAVFTSLPLPEHVTATYAELEGALEPGVVCVDVSTIDPATARAVADRLAAAGAPFLVCALGKGPAQAEGGEIPLFVGGPAGTVERVRPLLERIGNAIHHLGDVEAATMFKLVSNLIGMTNVAVLAEGYLLARRAGIEPDAFTAALSDTGAGSYQLDMRLPWMIADDHAPRFAVDLAAKDLRLAVDAAARAHVPTPVGAQGLSQLLSASAHGFGGEDVTAMLKVLDPPPDGDAAG